MNPMNLKKSERIHLVLRRHRLDCAETARKYSTTLCLKKRAPFFVFAITLSLASETLL